jgi:ATP-dependent Clp protease protease subunit
MRNKLINLIRDNLNVEKFYEIRNEGEDTVIYLYDAIDSWFGVDAQQFAKDLAGLDADTIHLRVNCPGGDVFDGRAMQTALAQHSAKVIAHIDGLCASAATYVVMGADEVHMTDGGFFMIHKGWTLQIGNADDMRSTAELLDKVDQSILNDYSKRTGLESDQLLDWMSAETWFTAEEAKEHGFIDEIFEGNAASNSFNVGAYNNAPQALVKPAANENLPDRKHLERKLALYEKIA